MEKEEIQETHQMWPEHHPHPHLISSFCFNNVFPLIRTVFLPSLPNWDQILSDSLHIQDCGQFVDTPELYMPRMHCIESVQLIGAIATVVWVPGNNIASTKLQAVVS